VRLDVFVIPFSILLIVNGSTYWNLFNRWIRSAFSLYL
jgi:hypothetical protein